MANLRKTTSSQNSIVITGDFLGTDDFTTILSTNDWLTSVTFTTNKFPIANPMPECYNLTELKFTYSGTVDFTIMNGNSRSPFNGLQDSNPGIVYASAGTTAAMTTFAGLKPPPNWTYSLYSGGGGGAGGGGGGVPGGGGGIPGNGGGVPGGGGAGGGGGVVPCFPKGTRVLTASGYKTVESLTQGELVQTADGRQVPVKLYGTHLSATNTVTAPFKIPKGVFGVAHDLLLSPDHAFQVQKGLWMIPKHAAALSEKVEQVLVGSPMTYYHIECPQYLRDNLVVDGVVVESYAGRQLSTRRPYTYSKTLQAFTRSGAVASKSLSL